MPTIDEFINYAAGKVFNNQGNVMNINYVQTSAPYGGQCASLIQGYMKYFGCEVKPRGNAIDWWRNFDSNGLNKYFTKSSTPTNGAVIITNGDATYGHIGIYYNGLMLQQNYASNPHARLLAICGTPYGYLIPKFLSTYSDSQLIKEHAIATFINDTKIIIRRDTPTGASYGSFTKGEVQEYTEKWVGNGHRWISWIHTNGVRCFAAISGSEIQGQDLWASFSSVQAPTEPSQPSGTINLAQEDGVATFTVDGVRARYDSPTGAVCKTYNSGDTIRYYWKWVGNGHRYVVGKDGDKKVFVAVSATEDRSQMWATFTSPEEEKKEEVKPTPTPTTKPTETKPTENTNGFSSVNEGEYEGHDEKDEIYDCVGIVVDLIDKSLYPYKCPYLMEKPQAIIIHNAATPNGTAKALNRALHNSKEYKSWHFSVDDKDIIQSLPLNRNAFATGDGAYGLGNRTGIHIEIAKDNDTDSREEWLEARDNGARLAAELLHKYGWGIDHLKKHQDYKMTDGTYKYCPHKILDEGWNEFKSLVSQYLDELSNPKKDDSNDSNDKINIDGINQIIVLILKLIKKVSNLFK